MRLAGVLLVALCGLLAGAVGARSARAEVAEAERIRDAVEYIRYLIKYTQAPSDEIMSAVEAKFGTVRRGKSSGMLREIEECADGLIGRLGHFQLDEQLSDCDRTAQQIEHCLAGLREDCKSRSRVNFALCSTVGIVLAIMLI